MLLTRGLALVAVASVASALAPAQVRVRQTCKGAATWRITAPTTTAANTPRFDVAAVSSSAVAASASTFEAHGSLGLPNHPLGLFKFNASGPAVGNQTVDVMDGVLGKATFAFSPGAVEAHIDVWTVIPDVPPLLSTGFAFDLTVWGTATTPLLCYRIELSQPPTSGADKTQDVCELGGPVAPPMPVRPIPSVIVDLNEPAATRWRPVVIPHKASANALIDAFIGNLLGNGTRLNGTLVNLLLSGVADVEMKRLPQEIEAEIKSVARMLGRNPFEIFVLNLMYELTGLCTSFVAQSADGHVLHGRNLDFGLFMGSDPLTHSWKLTQMLRDVLVNVEFHRDGKPLYNATTYAGFVGLLSGGKGPNGFSITVDTRYDATLDAGVIGWLLGKNDECKFLTFETRAVMEAVADYPSALHALVTYKPLGPAYIIIAGSEAGQGAVVAKAFEPTAAAASLVWNGTVDVWNLADELKKGSFYVLETNYDRTTAPPGFDDRRYPAENCLEKTIGAGGINVTSVMRLLSTNPTRNALTTFSVVMEPRTGYFEAVQQNCAPGPHCVPF